MTWVVLFALLQYAVNPPTGAIYAATFGGNAGAKIATAISRIPATGGVVSAVSLTGAQTWSSDPFSGVTKPVLLELGAGTTTISSNVTVPSNVTVRFSQGTILSVNSGRTLTINGAIDAPSSQIFAGSGTVNISALKVEGIFPQWWGCVGDGVVSCTTSIAAASVAASAGQAKVRFLPGTYLVTDEIVFALDRVEMVGDGQQVSIIKFNPSTTGKAAFHFKNPGSTTIIQFHVRGLTFDATGNTQGTKAAIRVTDGEEVIIDDIAIANWSSSGKDCIGLQLRGRQQHSVSHTTINADIPISIEDNPNNVIDADGYHFWDNFLIGDATQPCIKIATGINLYHVTVDGYQTHNVCKWAVYWNDTTSASVSMALTLKNIRHEQASDTAGYIVYIAHNTGLQGLILENLYGGALDNGIYLRKVDLTAITNTHYIGSLVGIDADSTVNELTFTNLRFNNSAATVTLTAKKISGSYYLGGNVITYLPSADTGAGVTHYLNPSATLSLPQIEPKTFSLTTGTNTKFAGDTMGGIVLMYTNTGFACIFLVRGTGHAAAEMSDPDGVCAVAAAGSNFNLYWDGGTSSYRIQNSTAGTVVFSMAVVGKGER